MASPKRSLLVDVAKGLAITLVAVGHTNQGEVARGYWGDSAFGTHLNAFVYAFHMPAFFFLSGIFLCQSVDRRGLRGFVAQKARTLLYPFLVWSVLIPVATLLFGTAFRLRPLQPRDVLLNLVTGNAAWFLPALFVALGLAASLRRMPALVLFVAACLGTYLCPPSHILAIDRGIWHLPFVVAGMTLGARALRITRLSSILCALAAALLATGLYMAVCRFTSPDVIRWGLLPIGLYGSAMLLLFARALLQTRLAHWIARVGQASLWIFVLAPFPQGLVRVVLAHSGWTHPLLQLLLPTLAAIAVPAWLYEQRESLHLSPLFAPPTSSPEASIGSRKNERA